MFGILDELLKLEEPRVGRSQDGVAVSGGSMGEREVHSN
jgi:hypothetical protein